MVDHPISDISSEDIIGLLIISLGLAIASSAGIGGGSIVIPLLLLLLHFSIDDAVPLGNAAVLGSTISNIVFTIFKPHPLALNRSIIDWDIVSMMEPNAMLGALLGAYLHKILPGHISKILLSILLCVTSYRTFIKGYKDYNIHLSNSRKEYQIISTNNETNLPIDIKTTTNSYHSTGTSIIDHSNKDIIITPLEIEQSTSLPSNDYLIPFDTIGILILLFSGTIIINLAKAFHLFSFITFFDGNIVITILLVSYIIIINLWLRSRVISNHYHKLLNNHESLEGDIIWNSRNSAVYPLLAVAAGMIAGLFGIGGGIVKAPLLIEMGVHPFVVSSTTTIMIFLTSLTAASSYIVYGKLQYDYAILLFLLGVISNVIGQTIVSRIVDIYKSSAVVTILIAVLVGISAVLMTLASIDI